MESPQLENGHFHIANELFEAIINKMPCRVPGPMAIFLAVMRETYGFNRKSAEISTERLKKLTGIDNWKFKYHKMSDEFDMTQESLDRVVPPTPNEYDRNLNKLQTEGIKRFFNKTLMDDLTLDGDVITIHKPFNRQIKLRMVKEAATDSILEGVVDAIIMDEAQNSTKKELTTLMTRVGHFSKLFICGDPMQSDINGKSGFAEMCNIFNDNESKEKGIHVFYLTEEDIVRSEIVKYIVKKLNLYNHIK
jgi:hypothetical protein